MHTKFLSESLKGRDHLEVLERILKWILKKYGVNWIHFAHHKNQKQDLMVTVINL
jgi:hypothetical protein